MTKSSDDEAAGSFIAMQNTKNANYALRKP
jgi:hypothetical protein